MNKLKYFGTDGIRGKVGDNLITPDFILKLGWAVGTILSKNSSQKIIIGKDTRISCYMLESALVAGITATGVSILFAGILPTPAIAYLTRINNANAGIVISASHNPYYDNGIKFFSIDGKKISHKIEQIIESELDKPLYCVESINLGQSNKIINPSQYYIDYCKSTFPDHQNLQGIKIILDCANGSTYNIAPKIFTELGAEIIKIGCKPNGININYNCGSTDISLLRKYVLSEKADIGLAFDGDGDRIIIIDHYGNKINGDQIIYIIACYALSTGQLYGGVVGTILSNMGLELAFKQLSIPFIRTQVGDRYIIEKLQEQQWYLGAENSGHIILLDKTTTSDGIIAGLQVLSAMIFHKKSLHYLCSNIKLIPQILLNVYVNNYNNISLSDKKILNIMHQVKNKLADQGRVILRKSGTESVIRILIEGSNKKLINSMAHQIANVIKSIDL